MGYRSDVCVALTDSATRLIKTIMTHLPKDHELNALVKEDEATFHEITQQQIADQDYDCDSKMYFEQIKWYDSFEDVGLILEILNHVDDEEWLITRVGQDTDDIEQNGSYWDSDVYISRRIEW